MSNPAIAANSQNENSYSLNIMYRENESSDDLKNKYRDFNRSRIENLDDNLYKFAKNEDSGFDLIVPHDYIFKKNQTILINFRVSCEMTSNINNMSCAYYLYPRSSIYKNDLIMMNSTGIIDSGYRGCLMSPIKWLGNEETNDGDTFVLKGGTRICQICSQNLSPFNTYERVELSDSIRGEGGFGSTGN